MFQSLASGKPRVLPLKGRDTRKPVHSRRDNQVVKLEARRSVRTQIHYLHIPISVFCIPDPRSARYRVPQQNMVVLPQRRRIEQALPVLQHALSLRQ
jgi:hypothetical protein